MFNNKEVFFINIFLCKPSTYLHTILMKNIKVIRKLLAKCFLESLEGIQIDFQNAF